MRNTRITTQELSASYAKQFPATSLVSRWNAEGIQMREKPLKPLTLNPIVDRIWSAAAILAVVITFGASSLPARADATYDLFFGSTSLTEKPPKKSEAPPANAVSEKSTLRAEPIPLKVATASEQPQPLPVPGKDIAPPAEIPPAKPTKVETVEVLDDQQVADRETAEREKAERLAARKPKVIRKRESAPEMPAPRPQVRQAPQPGAFLKNVRVQGCGVIHALVPAKGSIIGREETSSRPCANGDQILRQMETIKERSGTVVKERINFLTKRNGKADNQVDWLLVISNRHHGGAQ